MKIIPFVMLTLLAGISIAHADTQAQTIIIADAQYGMGNDVDATAGVGRLCDGKTSCGFKVNPGVMGVTDPVPGVRKSLRISWSCGKNGMKPVEYFDYDNVYLVCK